MSDDLICESCLHLYYDEELDEWFCDMQDCMDEDDVARQWNLPTARRAACPYYRGGDEYTIVRRQN